MKIPQELPQFDDQHMLLVVATRQTATLYAAHRGTLKQVAHVDVPNPTYSDNEGFFTQGGRGKGLGSGSVRETKKVHIQNEFLKQFKPAIETAVNDGAETICLFVPAHRRDETIAAFPYRTRRLIDRIIAGNFSNYEPTELLEKIAKRRVARKKAVSRAGAPKEARKILKKAKKGRRVIGT